MISMMNYWLDSKSTAWRFQELLFIQKEEEDAKSTSLFPSVCIWFLFLSLPLPSPLWCGEGATSPPMPRCFSVRFFLPSCGGSPCGCGVWRSCWCCQQPPLYTPPPLLHPASSLPPTLPRSGASSLSVWLSLKPYSFFKMFSLFLCNPTPGRIFNNAVLWEKS